MTHHSAFFVGADTAGLHGRFEEAMEHHQRGERDAAGKIYREILRNDPNHTDAMRNLIDVCVHEGRCLEAVPLAEKLVSFFPDSAEEYHRLGWLCGESGQLDAAKNAFRKGVSLPGGKTVWRWKHLAFCPVFFETENEIDNFWSNLNRQLDEAVAERPVYDWTTLVEDGFCSSFQLPHLNKCCRGVKEKFAKLFLPSFPFERPTYKPGKKIRVGFLVTPGHEGGFLRLNTGLIEQLDPEKFEVVLIYQESTASRFEGKFRRSGLIRLPFSQNFEQAVTQIRDARLDAIYYWKVGADNWSFFLPMCCLAPLQCTSWSTHGTSGLSTVDYYVSWNKAEPLHSQQQYTEKLVLLDAKPLYEPFLTDIPPAASRMELKLPEKGAIYFCPHRAPKYHPCFDGYLRQILERDSTGHILLLLGKPSLMMKRFVDRMRGTIGEDLFRRVIVLPQLDVTSYYRYLSASTVLLNSPIYSGEITAVDGFLYGVPCVSLTGELLVQRYATAFYDDFGIIGPAVSNQEEYVEQAVRLATDKKYHSAISRKIVENRDRFFENIETVHAWARFLEQATREQQTECPPFDSVLMFNVLIFAFYLISQLRFTVPALQKCRFQPMGRVFKICLKIFRAKPNSWISWKEKFNFLKNSLRMRRKWRFWAN